MEQNFSNFLFLFRHFKPIEPSNFIRLLTDPGFILLLTIVAGMIPLVGSAPIWIGGVIYHFSQDHAFYGIVVCMGGLVVSTADNIVRPIVMREHAEMHPLLALVS